MREERKEKEMVDVARERTLCGCDWRSTTPTDVPDALVRLAGTCAGRPAQLSLTRRDLATHTLMLGPSGTGKTNVLGEVLRQVKRSMRPGDAMCVFDPKGDFRSLFDPSRDVVVPSAVGNGWNIFGDVVADGWDEESLSVNAREIAQTVFADAVERSSNPFFPKAARDLFADVLVACCLCAHPDEAFRRKNLNNRALRDVLLTATPERLQELLGASSCCAGSLKYLGDGSSEQALGVLAELQEATSALFAGGFVQSGTFSSRQFLRHRPATAFVEYDIARASTPAYQVIVDSFLKEALAGGRSGASTYVVIDELAMLPHLLFLENALSFGRSRGVKAVAAVQSAEQIYDAYGREAGSALISGFQTLVCFRPTDEATRACARDRCGRVLKELSYLSGEGRASFDRREGSVVEDWDLASLGLGEAFVFQPLRAPLRFSFGRY